MTTNKPINIDVGNNPQLITINTARGVIEVSVNLDEGLTDTVKFEPSKERFQAAGKQHWADFNSLNGEYEDVVGFQVTEIKAKKEVVCPVMNGEQSK